MHTPIDIRMPSESPCPACGSRRYVRLACEHCPAQNLDQEVVASGLKGLIDRAVMLDIALEKGFHITLDDVMMDEFGALTVLWSEQQKHRRDDMEAQQRKWKEENASPVRASYKTRPI